MRRELCVSAGLHIALLLWVAFGDSLFHRETETEFQVTGVQIISTAEFEELTEIASLPPAATPAPAPQPEPEPAPQPEVTPQISAPPLGAQCATLRHADTRGGPARGASPGTGPPPPEQNRTNDCGGHARARWRTQAPLTEVASARMQRPKS